MTYYIAHWDWILLQSRAEVVKSLESTYKIEGIAPLEDNKYLLNNYSHLHDWKINRKKLKIVVKKRSGGLVSAEPTIIGANY